MTIDPKRLAEIDGIIGGLADTAAVDSALLLPEQVLAVYEAITDLRDALDAERDDDAEAWCARLANDREGEAALVQIGVAKALAVVKELRETERRIVESPPHPDYLRHVNRHVAFGDAVSVIVNECGPAPLPPHEKTLARLRRLEAALADLLSSTDGEMGRRARENARAALAPDPLN